MSSCNDYWCEYYGKGGEQCDRCVKKGVENDSSQLQMLLNRQVHEEEQIVSKPKGQER
jgi:hypothetical protein